MKILKTIGKIALFVLIIVASFGGYKYLASQKSDAPRKPRGLKTTIVEVLSPTPTEERVTITAMGTVVPAKSITLTPEVTGRVLSQHDQLVPGGQLRKGQIIARIDARDYDLALNQQRSRVVQAEMELAMERGRKAVAKREWNLIQEDVQPTEEGKKLALREIQLENAEATVESAKSLLAQAKLNRSRTVIRAPFNALITEEFIDTGQVVGPSTRIATLVASDVFWVRVAVPMDRLNWIHLPDIKGNNGSQVRVIQKVGAGDPIVRRGRVVKLLGDLDPKGKMARLLVEVTDPLGLKSAEQIPSLPLLLGAYVSVEIEGPALDGVLALPRPAVRENGRVWIKQNGALAIRQVQVIWTRGEQVFVREGITADDEVIISRIAAPVEGMSVSEEHEVQTDAGPPNPPLPSEGETMSAKARPTGADRDREKRQ